MARVVVCAARASWQQAGRFAEKVLGDVELRSFEDVVRRTPVQPILVYLTDSDYDRLRSLLAVLKPGSPDVVIYHAARPAPEEAAQLGRLVGETRPKHTSVVFKAKAAAASVLGHSQSGRSRPRKRHGIPSPNRARWLREHLGLTQTELAHGLGVSLRTIQNWEGNGATGHRQLRDLEELWDVLKDSMKA